MSKIQRAILSVTDKTGLVEFARKLAVMGVELVSTGGTAKLLRDSGISVKEISELTGFPEMLDGRVKTLHPKVHGGLLHVRSNPAHRAAVAEHAIPAIDMIVVNLYAFEKTAAKPGVDFDELIENIDIGGPSMIRSAAKNFQDVAVVTSPADYGAIAEEMLSSGGELSLDTKFRLAQKAFATTAAYDTAIASTLERVILNGNFELAPQAGLPPTVRLSFSKVLDLRYGENPHQKAALYQDASGGGIAHARQLQGKELSYNNIVDLQAAWDLAQEFDEPFCAIIKHTNPCGAANSADLAEAFRRAVECDPVAAFGGVVGVNRTVDAAAAAEMSKIFLECIAAPGFDPGAKEIFSAKKNLRLLEVPPGEQKWIIKAVSGGILIQQPDAYRLGPSDLKTVSERPPSQEELRALLFAWKVCKHVKSNAILYARAGQTLGVGAGQMSRVDSARIGGENAKKTLDRLRLKLPLKDFVAASDAFFPFPDGLEEIARAGATAVIQPGGSVRDQEVIAAANRLGMAMLFTGVRHFRH
jgi:phosphoribosylaminoimidazolecarboxamide formyltransferase/IMP cyclohydrolase